MFLQLSLPPLVESSNNCLVLGSCWAPAPYQASCHGLPSLLSLLPSLVFSPQGYRSKQPLQSPSMASSILHQALLWHLKLTAQWKHIHGRLCSKRTCSILKTVWGEFENLESRLLTNFNLTYLFQAASRSLGALVIFFIFIFVHSFGFGLRIVALCSGIFPLFGLLGAIFLPESTNFLDM